MTAPTAARRIAVVGGGWAGLAAAVQASADGHHVSVFEMAPMLGGRARRLPPDPRDPDGLALDNGQHILIGAYGDCLRLMRLVGVDPSTALHRLPLTLVDRHGHGLRLPRGPAGIAFVRGVLAARGWPLADRLALLRAAAGWLLRGFRCPPALTVAALTAGLPVRVQRALIDPLCVAALNTAPADASARVFLRVLHDALFAGPGSADLLLPATDLGTLWPDAAQRWLLARGASVATSRRVAGLLPDAGGWQIDGQRFDAAVLACSAVEAARLAAPHAPDWSRTAQALRHAPIVTVLVHAPGALLPAPMLALEATPEAPAQYVFDLGQLRAAPGVLAFVVSGAAEWLVRGLPACGAAVLAQARDQLGPTLPSPPTLLRTLSDKRATFLCTPLLRRPPMHVAPGLWAAGDHVDGPYPSTLEGAVRSGVAAARAIGLLTAR